MFLQTILSTFLFTFVMTDGFIHEELRKHLCATEGDFRGEFVKCLKTMPTEVQSVITLCGCIMQNETSCEYTNIIEDMCADQDRAQNVSQCVKLFMKGNHNMEFAEDEESEHHHPHHHPDDSDNHDHSQHDHNTHEDEEEDEDENPLPEIPEDCLCLKDLYSKYNITWKEHESIDEE